MNKIRVAIIGVGNCASSLVQGVEYYKNAKKADFIPGGSEMTTKWYTEEFIAKYKRKKIPARSARTRRWATGNPP